MGFYYSDEELAHHGIKGQRWGVRRFETEGGHLTAAGKQRYDGNPVSAKEKAIYADAKAKLKSAKSNYKKAKKYAGSYDEEDQRKFNNAQGMYDLRRRQASTAKAKMKMAERDKISKHEQKLIYKYKEKGMTEEEASLKAYKMAKLEKTLAIAGTVTVAAAAAYGAKKYHDYVTDEVLKSGSISMKRIAGSNTSDLHDTFYAAFSKGDVGKYTGLYGKTLRDSGKDVYQKTIDLKDDIRIASDKNARETMAEVLGKASNSTRNEAIKNLEVWANSFNNSKQQKVLDKGLADIKAGRYNTKAAYDALNISLSGNNTTQLVSDFKTALKDKGYSGIKDRNDATYSGYNAKSARIIFDNSKVAVSNIRKVADSEINDEFAKEVYKDTLKALAVQTVPYAAIGGAALGIARSTTSKARDNNAIEEYRQEHPNTKLSNDEILENVYGGNK